VPILEEWENAFVHNTLNKIGAWGGTISRNPNFGVKFGDNLMLPTAGARDEFGATDDSNYYKATATNWSRTLSYDGKYPFFLYLSSYIINKEYEDEYDDEVYVYAFAYFSFAAPVRCIKN